ncbi:unnamed protein product [Parascedosporium putredinis]|uniref:Uncharacterized protein n=1 Tax=Parascedosporium putredinis TaxID=1442378 RepID=A0A9P1GZR7_9PEZI|nr:unnamed protein product [Parascedosporium putredinis]CAI7993138.1 unnamed protein product [Parascedosporium putredinis]
MFLSAIILTQADNVLVIEYGDNVHTSGVFDPPESTWQRGQGGDSGPTWTFNSLPNPEVLNRTAFARVGQLLGLEWYYTKTDGLFPLPEDMSNETFLADTITGFNEIPARGPYTLALANMALYSSLADITPGYQSIVADIRNQVANDVAASYLPPSYRDDPTMIAGYKHQLLALADFLENPEAPSLEGPYVTGGDTFLPIMLHPLSRGTVRLNAADILDQPELDYRSISNPIDLDIHLAHTKYLRRVFETPTVQKYGPIVTEPRIMFSQMRTLSNGSRRRC